MPSKGRSAISTHVEDAFSATTFTLGATASTVGRRITVRDSSFFGIEYLAASAASAGSEDVELSYAGSYDGSNFGESASGDEKLETISANDIYRHNTSISPPPVNFIRLSAIGLAGNPADTVVTVKLLRQ